MLNFQKNLNFYEKNKKKKKSEKKERKKEDGQRNLNYEDCETARGWGAREGVAERAKDEVVAAGAEVCWVRKVAA